MKAKSSVESMTISGNECVLVVEHPKFWEECPPQGFSESLPQLCCSRSQADGLEDDACVVHGVWRVGELWIRPAPPQAVIDYRREPLACGGCQDREEPEVRTDRVGQAADVSTLKCSLQSRVEYGTQVGSQSEVG